VLTHGLIAPADHARLGLAADDPATIRVANPVTADHAEMRRSMLPGLLGVVARNERQRNEDLQLFEIGNLHEWRDGGPAQSEVLAVLGSSFEDVKGIVALVATRLGHADRVEYQPTQPRASVEHPGRTAAVNAVNADARTPLGRVFEVDPRLLAAFEVKAERVAIALLQLEPLRDLAERVPQVRRIDALPAIERDLAVLVKHDVPAADVEKAIRNAAGANLANLTLFDRYTGAPLAADEVSLAYRLRYQPADTQMTEQQIEESVANVTSALQKDVGGRIRSAG
jgi:phenylalanyl-tRNA synthetase beta chain